MIKALSAVTIAAFCCCRAHRIAGILPPRFEASVPHALAKGDRFGHPPR